MIGREQEVAAARALILRDDVRLVTLTGAPGAGKTRLALELASELSDCFRHGVRLVDLTPASDPDLIISAIAQPLGVREAWSQPLLDSVKGYLWDRRLLLVLDNFEQVLPGAPLLAELLGACPMIRLLITSRAALRLRWEHEFPVPPLALPDSARALPPDELARIAPVALFLERAQAVRPDFTLDAGNAATVAEICIRLEGLPLSIELAAAQSRIFPPEAMLPRLESRLDLLMAGAPEAPARHQTLRGAIGWSYSLLPAGERTLFRRLGIFVGGCTPEAAEAVCTAPTGLDVSVVAGISALAQKNLLWRQQHPAVDLRFRMLETVREYSLECLVTSRELDAMRQQHASYYLSLAEQAETGLTGPEQAAWLERLEADQDNLRAAARWLVERGEAELSVRLAMVMWRFWWVRGHLTEGRAWLAEILALPQLASLSLLRARALLVAGLLALRQGGYSPARTLLVEGLSIAREAGDARLTAFALTFLGKVARDTGSDESCALGAEAAELFRGLDDTWGLALALNYLGLAVADRDPVAARPLFEESVELFRQRGDKWDLAMPLRGLGIVAFQQGDYTSARALFEEGVALFQERGDEWGAAIALHDLGNTAQSQRDSRRAALFFAESLRSWRRVGNMRGVAMCLAGLAGVAAMRGLATRAALLFGAAEAVGGAAGIVLEPTDQTVYDRNVADVRGRLGEPAFAEAWAEGKKMSLEAAVDDALELEIRAAALGSEAGAATSGPLTPREREVAGLLALGLTNRQIAAALVITEGTANLHVKHILAKLGLTSRAQVAHWVAGQSLAADSNLPAQT